MRKCFFLIGFFLLISSVSKVAGQANFSSNVSGNWSNPVTWLLTSGTDADGIPDSDDAVLIISGHNITVDIVSLANSVRLDNGTESSSLTLNANLAMTGDLTIEEPNADNKTNTVWVNQFNLTAGGLNMDAGGAGNLTRLRFLYISTGTVSFSGNAFTGNSANTQIVFTDAGKMELGGIFTRGAASVFTVFTGSTVSYTGGAQTVVPSITYSNLTLAGSGAKTTTGVTVNGVLSMEGTATTTVVPTYGPSATLQYNTATARTSGVEWPATFSALGGIVIDNSGTITAGAAKTLGTGVWLQVLSGATFNPGAFTHTISANGVVQVLGTIDFSNATGQIRSSTSGTSTLFMGSTGVIKTIDAAGLGPATNASFLTQAGGTWDFSSVSTAGTIEYNRSTDATGIITDRDYYNLTISNANAKTWTPAAARTVNGSITINGVFTLSGSPTINIKGNWVKNVGTFNAATSVIVFNNTTADQSIGGSSASESFYALTVAKGSGFTLSLAGSIATVIATNTFTFTSGKINAGTGVLVVGVSAASTGTFTYTAGTIIGKFRRWVASGTTAAAIKFPVGSTSAIQTLDINFSTTNRPAGGSLTSEFKTGTPGTTGLPQNVGGVLIADPSPSGYWSVVNAGITGGNYTATVNASGFLFPNGVNTINDLTNTRLLKRSSTAGSSWESSATTGGTHSTPSNLNAVSASGLTTFSEFAVGVTCLSLQEQKLFHQSQCIGAIPMGFSVTASNTAGTTYEWFANTINSNSGGTSTGITTNNFTPSTTSASDIYYYCVVTRGCDNKTTGTAQVLTVAVPTANDPSDLTVCNGESIGAVGLTGTGNVYNWINDNPSIGLASTGSGNIPGFTAVNNGGSPITATVSVTPGAAMAYIPNRFGHSVSVVNTITNRIEKLISTIGTPYGNGAEPVGVVVNSDGSKVYLSNLSTGNVTIINTATNTVAGMMSTGTGGTHGIAISPDNSRVYTTNLANNTVSVFSTSTNTLIGSVGVGFWPIAVLPHPDGSKLYVTNQNAGTISVINATTLAIIATINTGGQPTGLAASPDGSKLYATIKGTNQVMVINTATNGITNAINVGNGPIIITTNLDGSRVYVSNEFAGNVQVINSTTNAIIATMNIPSPVGMSFTPDYSYLFVASYGTSTVSKIDPQTNTIVETYGSAPYVFNAPYAYGNFISKKGGCAGATQSFTITVNPTPTSPAANAQSFCNANNPTVANLQAIGTNLKWYTTSSGGVALNNADPLATGTYYVSQTVATCESARTAVAVTVEDVNVTGLPLANTQDVAISSISTGNTINLIATVACRIIATVESNGTNPASGTVNAKAWIEPSVPAYSGQPFVARHYEITPSTNPVTSTAKVTLYFTQQEFDNFNTHPNSLFDLPANSADATGIGNLRIGKYAGTSNDGSGLPGSYAGAASVIDPADNDIVWNSTLSRWEISFAVTGFSGFVVHTSNFTLPLTLLDFNGRLFNSNALLNWKTDNEINTQEFIIERSLNGRNYSPVGSVNAMNTSGVHQYNFTDPNITTLAGNVVYYRLQQKDIDGRVSYSRIIALTMDNKNLVIFYPNPVTDNANLAITLSSAEKVQLRVIDIAGRILKQQLLDLQQGSSSLPVDMKTLAKGMYYVELKGESLHQTIKVIKQ